MSDVDFAVVCQQSYVSDTHWDRLWTDDSIYVGMIEDTVCFRGSDCAEDWLRDFDALAINDPELGGLHAGFSRGIANFFTVNQKFFNSNTSVCGHSLGAARALIFSGYMVKAGIIPKQVAVFGSPRPGFSQLSDILAPVAIRSYKNRADPVTDVPVGAPPFFPYIHPRASIAVNAAPPADDIDPLADHSIALYVEGLISLGV